MIVEHDGLEWEMEESFVDVCILRGRKESSAVISAYVKRHTHCPDYVADRVARTCVAIAMSRRTVKK